MDTADRFSCRFCGDCFTRQDHLSRHELSHGEAKFYCKAADCGMAFHRRDVLRRHERVHLPDPTKKRRRPRRGIIPSSKPAQLADHSQLLEPTGESPVTSACAATREAPIQALVYRGGSGAERTLRPLDFCFVHYVQLCTKRWPFMHSSKLQQEVVSREKRLAMAALGGCVIPEYRDISATFFEEAKQSLILQHGSQVLPAVEHRLQDLLKSRDEFILELLQTHVLLLEYALWQKNLNTRKWAVDLSFEYASAILPHLIKQIRNLKTSQCSWEAWVYEEQLIRAMWTFNCVIQRAMDNFPCSISILRLQKHLRLPRSDILFNALDEQKWSESRSELALHGVHLTDITLQDALQLLSSRSSTDTRTLASLTPITRQIVLVALLEIYGSGFRYLTFDAAGTDDSFTFLEVMRNVRSLWHSPPSELFFSTPPRSLDFQNVLLMNHLYIRVLLRTAYERDSEQYWSKLCEAATVANEIFVPALKKGAISINSEAAWLTDSASKRYVVGMAQVMVDWARMLKRVVLGTTSFSSTSFEALHTQLTELLCLRNAVTSNAEKMEQFVVHIQDAWSDILRCPIVRWYHQHDYNFRDCLLSSGPINSAS